MMYHDEVRTLALKANVYNAHKKTPGPLDNFNSRSTIENKWGASYFCAAVLYKSQQEQFHTLKMEDVESLKVEFKLSTGYDVEISSLFDKGWLREVFSIISVPSMIKAAAEYAVKIQTLKNELSFFRVLHSDLPERGKKISITDLEAFCQKYETLNSQPVNLEISKDIFWRQKDETVEIVDTSIANIVMDDIESFLFINEVAKAAQDKHIYIEATDLTILYDGHAAFFPLMPSFDQLLKDKVFFPMTDGNRYIINFRYSELKFESVVNKYAAILWDKLLADDQFDNDEERLFFWYSRLLQNEDRVDIKKHFVKKLWTGF